MDNVEKHNCYIMMAFLNKNWAMDNVQKHNCYITIIIYRPPLHLVLLSQMQSSHCQHQHQYLHYLCITVLSPFCLYSHNLRISCYYFCALLPCPHKVLSLLFSLLSLPLPLYPQDVLLTLHPFLQSLFSHHPLSLALFTASLVLLFLPLHLLSLALSLPHTTIPLPFTPTPPSPYKGKGKTTAVTGFRRLIGL
jgi:hypothetical protein